MFCLTWSFTSSVHSQVHKQWHCRHQGACLHQENRAGSFTVGCWTALEPVYTFKSHKDLSQQVPGLKCPPMPSMRGSLETSTRYIPRQQCPKEFRSEGGAFDPCILCLLALPCPVVVYVPSSQGSSPGFSSQTCPWHF